MKYFAASLFYRSECPYLRNETLWEDKILVIRAETEDHAKEIANDAGRRGSHEYETKDSGTVKWVFVKVERVVEILGDIHVTPVEVFARFITEKEAHSLLRGFKGE